MLRKLLWILGIGLILYGAFSLATGSITGIVTIVVGYLMYRYFGRKR